MKKDKEATQRTSTIDAMKKDNESMQRSMQKSTRQLTYHHRRGSNKSKAAQDELLQHWMQQKNLLRALSQQKRESRRLLQKAPRAFLPWIEADSLQPLWR